MTYPGFSKLQSDEPGIFEDDVPPVILPKANGRRPRPFTRFELGLIITLILFATALAAYTVVYIVQHQGAIRPAAVAALSCVALLLLVVAYSIHQRIRRPNWFRDVESGQHEGGIKKWNISAPIPVSIPPQVNNMSELTLKSKPTTATYTTLSSSNTSSKGRLQKKDRSGDKDRGGRLAFWLSSSSKRKAENEDYEHLISSSARSSSEMSEGGYHHHQPEETNNNQRPRSLWRSVFELPGEGSANTTRPTAPELPAGDDVQIVVTRPEPTARQSLHRGRAQSSGSLDIAAIRNSMTLAVDPLRSNPFHLQQLKRDPSVRQTKSSHALGAVPISVTPPPSAPAQFPAPPRRPRSAEPGPDRARLGHDLATVQLQIDRAVAQMESNSRRVEQYHQQRETRETPRIIQMRPPPPQPQPQPQKQQQQSRSESRSRSISRPGQDRQRQQHQSPSSRALRRAKSPVVDIESAHSGQDLRRAYQSQTQNSE